MIALGKFFKGDEISCVIEAKSDNEITYGLDYSISSSSRINSFRVYANGYSDYDVYVSDGDEISKVTYTIDGSYFDIVYDSNIKSITIKNRPSYSYLIYVGVGVAAVVIVGTIVTKKVKKKKAIKKD